MSLGLQANQFKNKKLNKISLLLLISGVFWTEKRLASFARKRSDFLKNKNERNQLINWLLQ
jgi:hypothetical protein